MKKTVAGWLQAGIELWQLPIDDLDAIVEAVPTAGTRFTYWFRYTYPSGETSEIRG
jgi:hypothetical protein